MDTCRFYVQAGRICKRRPNQGLIRLRMMGSKLVRDRCLSGNVFRMHNTPAMSENDMRMSSVNLSCLVFRLLSSSGY
jgi:hypothetical protein